MIALRSLVFNVIFYVNLALFLVLGFEFFFTPRKWSVRALQAWASTSLWLLRVVAGTGFEVRGREHIPQGAALVAGKHQSFWETFAILPLLDDPAMVLKKELTYIPFFGWFIRKFRMIAVERSAGSTALRQLIKRGAEEIGRGRQVVIMPEGTRRGPGDPPAYKPGAAALYGALGVPCVPFALNSGLYWPRRRFQRYPGTIVIEFLPSIPAGLPRREFQERLENAIEIATTRLVEEGHRNRGGYK
ncbi:MAG: 1-acyl-sn-glycerol-3-phosphate acyltransferase [Rhizobiales bacterium]|nr:1-acyl-sn-glycerol-3-phosphate acyltransferase [Hyphomicrobiales bacterium]MBI3672111.1 1-acyl-sn-glycerol-3-phosphate acyltransferase [Hyphomicrobiales bacterium]